MFHEPLHGSHAVRNGKGTERKEGASSKGTLEIRVAARLRALAKSPIFQFFKHNTSQHAGTFVDQASTEGLLMDLEAETNWHPMLACCAARHSSYPAMYAHRY
jgi:hypothetical protein